MYTPNDYVQFWGSKKISRTYLKKMIDFDYSQLIQKVDGGHRMIGGNKKLISPSSILKPFKEWKFFGIPNTTLEQRRADGSTLMSYLEQIFITKDTNINSFPITAKQKKDLHNLFQFFIEKNIKLIAVEKPITNGIVYGIVDCIVKKDTDYYVMEIKLRNNLTIENSDRFQASVYANLLEIPALIVCLADNGQIAMEEIRKSTFNKEMKKICEIYKTFGIELDFKQKLKIN